MADLLEEGTEVSPPFTYCGIDCFGPFIVNEGRKNLQQYLPMLQSSTYTVETLDDLTTYAFRNAI